VPDQPRPVWLNKAQRDFLAKWAAAGESPFIIATIISAWDAAPADPAKAVITAIWPHPGGIYSGALQSSAKAALRALGMPDAQTKEPA